MNKLFNEIRAVHGTTLPKEQAREQEQRKEQLKAKGISVLGDVIMERRDFVTGNTLTPTEQAPIQHISREPLLWRYLTVVQCVSNVNIPSVEGAALQWKEEGFSNIQDLTVEGFAAKPHRLVVTNRISRDFDKQVSGLKAGILEEYLHKSEGKVINTMLSTYTQPTDPTDSTPAPIFSTYTGVATIDDIVSHTSQLKGANMWVISPSAVADILTIYGADALNGSKLMGYPYIVEENAEAGYFYFGDFSKLYVADFELYPFTFDDITRAHLNEIQVTAESWWDYQQMGGSICKFKYEPATSDTEPTDPTE
ncbi:MAG: phage major capsid protein [Bacteroidales bacterium]|nr:phage major capsid protein [Bacteroidales bacterium]MBQ6068736.1 phage major capsid protein [Bacteroidales bacterium]